MSSEKSDTRSRILRATWELMEQHLGQGVRMSDIAKHAGVSRQAVYLHFETRADLLIATTRFLDEVKDVDKRLQPSRTATTGRERIIAYIAMWGQYLPEIQGIARALLAMYDSDADAAAAWDGRMAALRDGCNAAIRDLYRDGELASDWTVGTATDLFCAMLSFRNWETLTGEYGWTQGEYIDRIQRQALRTFVK